MTVRTRTYILAIILVSAAIYSGCLLGPACFRALGQTGTITGSVVNVRPDPSTQNDRIGCLYSGTEVQIIGRNGEWYQIKFANASGWIHSSVVGIVDSALEVIVSKDQVNLRSGPGTAYSVVEQARKGDVLVLVDVVGEWYKVKTGSGQTVYIRADMTGTVNQTIDQDDKIVKSASASGTTPTQTIPAVKIAVESKSPSIVLDGQILQFEVAPLVDNNRVLVPLRAIFEAMGATVVWNQAAQTATATLGETKVVLPLNSTSPTVNGKIWPLDVPAKVVNQRTLAPLRFVGEALGGTAAWDSSNYKVILTSPEDDQSKVVAVVITANTVNLRSEPIVNSDNVVSSANYGERLDVLNESSGWYQVNRDGAKVWVAGWLVDVVREGEPSAAPESSPVADPEPEPAATASLAGLTLTSERSADGLAIIMESGQKLDPDIDRSSGQVIYNFANRKIEGTASLEKYLVSDKLTVAGGNSGTSAVVKIQFPAGTYYETISQNNGKREVFIVPNYIAGLNRKTFGSSGENITINTIAPIVYTSTPTANKLEVVLKGCILGQAQSSYKYPSPLITGMTFKKQTINGFTNTVLTITTSKAAKFSVGTSNDDSTLNILFVDKSTVESRTPLVVLDAGHGGRDPGASGDDLAEKDVNLKLVLKAGKILAAKGIKVIYTRQDDTYASLDERTSIANLLNAALFVSVHNNANISSAPSGTETYCYYPLSDPDLFMQKEERYNLALSLQEALVDKLGRLDRGVKQSNLAVLRESEMPSALVEMVFISNPAEETLLKKDSFLNLGAQAIAEGIAGYMKSYVTGK